jgi:checkpoint serine/threonine-protein kinase
MSFEELRAMKRGWMGMDWRRQKEPLQQISGNSVGAESQPINFKEARPEDDLPEQSDEKLTIYGQQSHSRERDGHTEHKSGKPKKFKEQGNTQTGEQIRSISIPNVS